MTTKQSRAPAHAFAIFGLLASPIIALHLDHHYRLPFVACIILQDMLVFLVWRWLLPKKPTVHIHVPVALPPSLTVGSGPTRIYCDHEGLRLGPDTLAAASPFDFNEDVRVFHKNRYEMFISWTEVATLMDLNPHEGSLQIVYNENPYKAWVAFQPPAMTKEEHLLLKAFILQGGKTAV